MTAGPTGNSFLDALPSSTKSRLLPELSLTALASGDVLGRAGDPIATVYFPIQSVISTLTQMQDGNAVEVGLTGRDGLSGFTLVFNTRHSEHLLVAQVPDSALQVDAVTFTSLLEGDASLRTSVLAYAGYAFNAATRFAACNRLHGAEERFARWILMASDRVRSDSFFLTHEFAAQMLGVRRPSISIVAGTLSKAGIIQYVRGAMNIVDRDLLQEIACECYVATDDSLRAAMGYALIS